MNKFFAALVALIFVSMAAQAVTPDCDWTTSDPDFDSSRDLGTGATGLRYYMDNDTCQTDGTCLFSTWIYEEGNGIDGLQRGDEVIDDTCDGLIESDIVIF